MVPYKTSTNPKNCFQQFNSLRALPKNCLQQFNSLRALPKDCFQQFNFQQFNFQQFNSLLALPKKSNTDEVSYSIGVS